MTTTIELDGEIVAFVGASRAYLAPSVDRLEDGAPKRQLVLLMCEHALTHRPYDEHAAEAFARTQMTADGSD